MGKGTHWNMEGPECAVAPIKDVVILGSGNVATHLAVALDGICRVSQVWSRNTAHATELASALSSATAVEDVSGLKPDADLYIVAVADHALSEVLEKLDAVPAIRGIVAHTSGTVSLETVDRSLRASSKLRPAVFYPLQTFSKNVPVNLAHVPFLIEAKEERDIQRLKALANGISDNVHEADSLLRSHLHVAAVFANNFTNYALDLADRYLKEHTDFDITIFKSLLEETFAKAMNVGPFAAQTGPAKRGDVNVMQQHMERLDSKSAEVYRLLSSHIMSDHRKNE